MTVRAYILMTPAQLVEARKLDDQDANIGGRVINNPLANNLGLGIIVGMSIAGAWLLNDPLYQRWYATLGQLPIYTFDTDILFLPEQA